MPDYEAFHVPTADAARVYAALRKYVAESPDMRLRKRKPQEGMRTFILELASNLANMHVLLYMPDDLNRFRTTGTDRHGNPLT